MTLDMKNEDGATFSNRTLSLLDGGDWFFANFPASMNGHININTNISMSMGVNMDVFMSVNLYIHIGLGIGMNMNSTTKNGLTKVLNPSQRHTE